MHPDPPVIFGISITDTSSLPHIPDHKEDARRIVRHRMHELAPWLRFNVGPEPGAECHAVVNARDAKALVSPQLYEELMFAWKEPDITFPSNVAMRTVVEGRRGSTYNFQSVAVYTGGSLEQPKSYTTDWIEEWDRERKFHRMMMSIWGAEMHRQQIEIQERYAWPRRFIAGIDAP